MDQTQRRRFFGIFKNLRRLSKIGISSKMLEEPKIFWRIERKMRNLKNMHCEKNSDEIDHYKNFGHQKVFSIFIQKIDLFCSIFPQNFFNKRWFFLKNLRNLRSFEDSLTCGNGQKMKTKMDLQSKIFEERRSSKLRCNTAPG